MCVDLQWQTNPRATILQTLRWLSVGTPVIDHSIVSLLASCVPALREAGLDDQFWCQLLAIASRDADLLPLVEAAVQRSQQDCSAHAVSRILGAAEQRVWRSELDVTEELRLRQRPLRELWEASGPGLLHQIGRSTRRPALRQLQVEGLLPLRGGFGQAFAQAERVQMELVLTHPAADVPEVIRLAWLIAQLSIPAGCDTFIDRLALVPCCLAAAEQLGLSRCQPETLALALRQWWIADQRQDELAVALHQWWMARDEDLAWYPGTEQLRELLTSNEVIDR